MSLLRIRERERTAVGTGEEYLLNVGLYSGHGIDMKFIFIRISTRLLPSFHLMTARAGGLAGFRNLGVGLLGLGFSAGAEGWDELYATFVEGQRMTEVHDGIVRAGEWQVFWNQADRLDGVPTREVRRVTDR